MLIYFCAIHFCFCQYSKARRQEIAEIFNSEFTYVWFGSYFFPISRTFVVKTFKLLQTTSLCFQLDTISIFLFCNEQLFKVADCCEIAAALLPLPPCKGACTSVVVGMIYISFCSINVRSLSLLMKLIAVLQQNSLISFSICSSAWRQADKNVTNTSNKWKIQTHKQHHISSKWHTLHFVAIIPSLQACWDF